MKFFHDFFFRSYKSKVIYLTDFTCKLIVRYNLLESKVSEINYFAFDKIYTSFITVKVCCKLQLLMSSNYLMKLSKEGTWKLFASVV